MKTSKRRTIVPMYMAIFLLFFFPVGWLHSQEPLSSEDTLIVSPPDFALSEIPGEIIALSNHLIEILTKVAGEHPNTHADPSPMVVFNGYGSYALDFTLYCWVRFNVSLSTKSDIALGIYKALAAAGIDAPWPVQKIRMDPDGGKT